jgi:CRISPR-associated protein Csx16
MTSYFVTRHPGAVEWARRRGIEAAAVDHLDADLLRPGDVVMGTLPVQLIAAVTTKGARYLHLEMTVPREARGTHLSADDMERFGARLIEYRAERVGDVQPG